jgi:hypothetical protein
MEITMNNRQNINTFDTRYLGNVPGKTPKGKLAKERFLVIELVGNFLSLQQHYFQQEIHNTNFTN